MKKATKQNLINEAGLFAYNQGMLGLQRDYYLGQLSGLRSAMFYAYGKDACDYLDKLTDALIHHKSI